MPKRSRRHRPQPANTLASVDSKPSLLDFKSSPLAAPKTVGVLSLTDLEKDPATRDRYISTLPYFDRCPWDTKDLPPCDCTFEAKHESPFGCKGCKARNAFARRQAKAIKTTAKRWVWFSNARKVNDERGERLGTLIYLPLEIRQEIFRMSYDCEGQCIFHGSTGLEMNDLEFFSSTEPEGLDFYEGHGFGTLGPSCSTWGIKGLRLASPSTKAEFDCLYLSKTRFWFGCPLSFTKFLGHIPTTQHSQLRSVNFSLSHYCYSCDQSRWNYSPENLDDHKDWFRKDTLDWMALFANLPPGLTSLEFELGYPPCLKDSIEARRSALRGLKSDESFHHLLGLIIALSKQARRRSPGVHLKWSAEDKDCYSFYVPPGSSQYYLKMLDDVCKDPDKWSEEWLDGCEEPHEGCEMVVNWRRLRQDGNAMSPARKSQEIELKR